MVKINWMKNKIRIQRMFLIGIAGAVVHGILRDYMSYHHEVSEYMESMAYREYEEAKKEYQIKMMKRNQQMFSSDVPVQGHVVAGSH